MPVLSQPLSVVGGLVHRFGGFLPDWPGDKSSALSTRGGSLFLSDAIWLLFSVLLAPLDTDWCYMFAFFDYDVFYILY